MKLADIFDDEELTKEHFDGYRVISESTIMLFDPVCLSAIWEWDSECVLALYMPYVIIHRDGRVKLCSSSLRSDQSLSYTWSGLGPDPLGLLAKLIVSEWWVREPLLTGMQMDEEACMLISKDTLPEGWFDWYMKTRGN